MLDPRILRLVAITDDAEDQRKTLVDRVAAAVRGGATSVQVRLKSASAREVVEITKAIIARVDVPVIVNDQDDRYVVYVRADRSHTQRPDVAERPLISCASYEEARRIQRYVLRSSRACVIRFVGTAGGGD